MTGLAAVTSPARLIMITEQTRDWEAGSFGSVFASLRRYSIGAFVAMVVSVPFLYWWMPDLITLVFGDSYAPASDAARLLLIAGAVGLVFAWTKSLPVSVGKPELRIVTHGVETARARPAHARARIDVGRDRRRRGRADLDGGLRGGVARRDLQAPPAARAAGGDRLVKVLVVSGIWPPDVGGPASHAPELSEFLVDRGHRVEVVITADAPPAPERYPVHWISRAQHGAVRYARGSALVSKVAAEGGRRVRDRHVRPDTRGHAGRTDTSRAQAHR